MNQQAKMPNTKEYNLYLKIRISPAFHRVGVREENGFRVIFKCEGCGTPRSNRGSILKVGETGPEFKCKRGCRGGSATILQARNVPHHEVDGVLQFSWIMSIRCDNYEPVGFVTPAEWNAYRLGVNAAVVIPNAHDAQVDGVAVRVELIDFEFRRIN